MTPMAKIPLAIDTSEIDEQLAQMNVQLTTLTARLAKLEAAPPVQPVPVPVPTPNQPPLFDQWKADVVKYADLHGAKLLDTTLTGAERLDLCYYDAAWISHNLAEYFHRPDWLLARDEAIKIYRAYLFAQPRQGAAAGWMIFPHGLYHHYQATKDEESKRALLLLSLNAAYAQKGEPIRTWLGPISSSREAAYNLMADLYAQDLGSTDTDILSLVSICLGHLAQWRAILDGTNATPISAPPNTVEDVRPFMVGITCQALIECYSRKDSPLIKADITDTLNLMWEKMYVPASKAFCYTDRTIPGVGERTPAPDLNMLIAPAYAWIGQVDRADLLFEGSVQGAFLSGHKQFNQSTRWVFEYLKWRVQS
jgi:hypothetical protein